VPDFLATLVTEAVIHHLELIASRLDPAEPPPAAVTIALDTLEGSAAPDGRGARHARGPRALPPHWGEREALLNADWAKRGHRELDAARSPHARSVVRRVAPSPVGRLGRAPNIAGPKPHT
jgi:hypothetical protein